MHLTALLLLLHGSGPLDLLMTVGPAAGVLALIGGLIVAPCYYRLAKLDFLTAYGIAVGGLVLAFLVVTLSGALLESGHLDDRSNGPRMMAAMAGSATTMITLGALVPGAGRVLRVVGLTVGITGAGFLGFLFLVA